MRFSNEAADRVSFMMSNEFIETVKRICSPAFDFSFAPNNEINYDINLSVSEVNLSGSEIIQWFTTRHSISVQHKKRKNVDVMTFLHIFDVINLMGKTKNSLKRVTSCDKVYNQG